jgi:hypothetical protein
LGCGIWDSNHKSQITNPGSQFFVWLGCGTARNRLAPPFRYFVD